MYKSNNKEMTQEIWKDIPNYEGIYQASNLGNIRSLDRKVWNYNKKGRILKQNKSTSGYLYVTLNGKKYYTHILIAKTFLNNDKNLEQVNHKDFNKLNNCVNNLEWISRIGNIRHYRKSKYCEDIENKRLKNVAGKVFQRILENKNNVLKYYNKGLPLNLISKKCGIGRDFVVGIIKIYWEYLYDIQK